MLTIVPCRLTVSFEELDGSPQESICHAEVGPSVAVRTLRCAAADRRQLIREFLGFIEVHGNQVVVHRPHAHQVLDGWIVALTADTAPQGKIEGDTFDNRFAEYPYNDVIIRYGEPPIMAEAFGSLIKWRETLRGASEFVTLTQENLTWQDATPIEPLDAPARINSMTEWTIDIEGMRTLPNFGFYKGKINLNTETSYSGQRFAAGTLLCESAEVVYHPAITGITYDVTLRFLAKNNGTFADPKGWNYFPNPGLAGAALSWEMMKVGADNKLFYIAVDFTGILFVPSH